jgi:hypothetical protein
MTTLAQKVESVTNGMVDALESAITSKVAKAAKETTAKVAGSKDKTVPIAGSFATMAADCGSKLAQVQSLTREAEMLKAEVNKIIKALHEAKIEVGRNGKCAVASAFSDALMNAGMSKGTAQNYCTVFREAVKTGKAVTQWNPARNGDSNKGKINSTKDKPTLAVQLLKAFNFGNGEEFKALCFRIEQDFIDDKVPSYYAGFVSYLESEGVEIAKEGEK